MDHDAQTDDVKISIGNAPCHEDDGRDVHAWPVDYSDGDTCDCGAFYLFRDRRDGSIRIEATRYLVTR